MPVRSMPRDPNIEQLRNRAKTLQRLVREGEPGAVDLVREFHPRFANLAAGSPEATRFTRADMQLTLARSYGFPSWPKLRAHIETVNRLSRNPHLQPVGNPISNEAELIDEFLRVACLTYGADDPARPERARALLAEHPQLASATIHTASAVGDVAAAQALLAADSAQARFEVGPYRWEPLLYLAYSRVDSPDPGHSPLDVACLLPVAGADPNAGYLWESEYPFTALTGAFGDGESGRNTPPHRDSLQLARLLLDGGADPTTAKPSTTGNGEPTTPTPAPARPRPRRGNGHRLANPPRPRPPHTPGACRGRAARRRYGRPPRKSPDAARAGRRRRRHRLRPPDPLRTHRPPARRPPRQHRDRHTRRTRRRHPPSPRPHRPAPSCVHAPRPHRGQAAPRRRARPRRAARRRLPRPGGQRRRAPSHRRHPLLIDIGFNLNPTDRRTPLHEAAFHGHLDLVRALIDLGADPTIADPDHHSTPLGWARYNQQHDVAAYLAKVT